MPPLQLVGEEGRLFRPGCGAADEVAILATRPHSATFAAQ